MAHRDACEMTYQMTVFMPSYRDGTCSHEAPGRFDSEEALIRVASSSESL